MTTLPLETLVERLTSAPGRDDRLTHLEVLPPRTATPLMAGPPMDTGPLPDSDFGVQQQQQQQQQAER